MQSVNSQQLIRINPNGLPMAPETLWRYILEDPPWRISQTIHWRMTVNSMLKYFGKAFNGKSRSALPRSTDTSREKTSAK